MGIKFTIQFFQVQLDWSRRNLSLSIFFGFVFVDRLGGFHLFCVLVHDLRYALQYQFSFRFLNLLYFSMLNENVFVTCKVKR